MPSLRAASRSSRAGRPRPRSSRACGLSRALFEREFVEAEQAAYWETAIEDDEIALRMDRGRKALLLQGMNQSGPYQSPMEDGMLHFHEYLRRELGKPV